MRQKLEKLLASIEALRDAAQEKADESEREATQDRYTNIANALDEAINSVQEAIDEFDS
jgi:signal transduction histidine kinase